MRDQYAGDLSDLLKFALLRAIAAEGSVVGVGWYYNPEHDGRVQDGRHREYCDEAHWGALDLELVEALRGFSERSVAGLERLPIWLPNAIFHSVPVPRRSRLSWATEMRSALQRADLVFLDPDNGVGKAGPRHATMQEIEQMSQLGRPLVLIKFPEHQNHDTQVVEHHKLLLEETKAAPIFTIRTCVSVQVRNIRGRLQRIPRARWFTVLNANDALVARARRFTEKLNNIENCKADMVVAHLSTKPYAELPGWDLGPVGSLHRREIYDGK